MGLAAAAVAVVALAGSGGGVGVGVQAFLLPPPAPAPSPSSLQSRAAAAAAAAGGWRRGGEGVSGCSGSGGHSSRCRWNPLTAVGGGVEGAGAATGGGGGGSSGPGSSARQQLSDMFDALHAKRDARDQAAVLEVWMGVYVGGSVDRVGRSVFVSIRSDPPVSLLGGGRSHHTQQRRHHPTTLHKTGRAGHTGERAGADPEALHHAHLRAGGRGLVAGDGAGPARDEGPGVDGEQGKNSCTRKEQAWGWGVMDGINQSLCSCFFEKIAKWWDGRGTASFIHSCMHACFDTHTKPTHNPRSSTGDVRRGGLGLRLRPRHGGGAARDGRDARRGSDAGRGRVL